MTTVKLQDVGSPTINPSLNGVARRLIKKYGKEAVPHFERAILADAKLTKAAIHFAARQLVARVRMEMRRRISGNPQARTIPDIKGTELDHEIAAAIDKAVGKYYSWPLTDGTSLADADREHVVSEANKAHVMAIGNMRTANFLRLVAAGMRNGQTVKAVYKEQELGELYEQAVRQSRDE